MTAMEYGQIVFSKKGRDKGKPFIVVDAHQEYLYLADGKLRTLTRPKKKKIVHIQSTSYIADLTTDGRVLQDADLRKQINKFVLRSNCKEAENLNVKCSLGKGGNPIG